MYILYVYQSYHINYRQFNTIQEAKSFYQSLNLDSSYVCTIESSNLSQPIILQGA